MNHVELARCPTEHDAIVNRIRDVDAFDSGRRRALTGAINQ